MSASLVADYESSEEGSEGTDNELNIAAANNSTVPPASRDPVSSSVNFFGGAADENDSDDDNGQSEKLTKSTPDEVDNVKRLPNPLSGLLVADGDDDDCRSSVFTNYFHRAEEAKLAVLERHVKLTAAEIETAGGKDGKQNLKGGKKRGSGLCVNYQRGRCRFGDKCRFAHSAVDNGPDTGTAVTDPGLPTSFTGRSAQCFGGSYAGPPQGSVNFVPSDEDEDSFNAQKKHKLRSGITDNLVPPKRALQSLEQQRKQERPWTIGQQ
jgi:hypothetical protein